MAKFEYMQRAFSSELKPRARLVLQVLVLHCNKEGECFPSIKTIAAKCGYGVSTVKRALDELVKAGYIVKQARFDERKNGGQTSNLYTADRPAISIPYALTCPALTSRKTPLCRKMMRLMNPRQCSRKAPLRMPVTPLIPHLGSSLPLCRQRIPTPLQMALKQKSGGRIAARFVCGLGGSPFFTGEQILTDEEKSNSWPKIAKNKTDRGRNPLPSVIGLQPVDKADQHNQIFVLEFSHSVHCFSDQLGIDCLGIKKLQRGDLKVIADFQELSH